MPTEAQSRPQLPKAGVWTADPHHSTVAFHVKHHAVGTFRGCFEDYEATYDAASGVLNGSVDAASIKTFDMLALELRGEDFLDVERHPKVTFTSTSVKSDGGLLTIEGD